MRVTLVSTVHAERGAVTVPALVTVLERLSPGVVFAEVPRSYAERYANGSHGTLESRAVAEYSRSNSLTVVAVDRDKPSEDFFRVTRDLLERVERASRDYRNLVDHHSAMTASGGLMYLNSAASAATLAAMRDDVPATIDWIRAPHLHAVNEMWLNEIELRDREMIANISQCAAEGRFTSGVFLVGAAHRQSLLDKIHAAKREGTSTVDWRVELPGELFG